MKGKFRQLLTLALVFFSVVFAQAQVRTYSGVVVSSEDGQTLPGVNIKIAGTSRGTSADFDGNFSVSAQKGQTLVFSFVGYKDKSVLLGDARELTITLDPNEAMLDDVVIVAYGTAKKKDLTGAITTLKSSDIKNRSVSTVTRALEGQISGIQTTSSTGQPGSDANIYIRGIGSFNASRTAMILLDGVPYPSTLSTINPDDIATVTVMKDAASTSLYGSRAANGIVAVTTKRGQVGKANVALNVRMGFNENGVPNYDVIKDPGQYYQQVFKGFRGYAYQTGGMDWASASNYAINFMPNLGYLAFKLPEPYESGASGAARLAYLIDPATGKVREGSQLLYNEDWEKILYTRQFRQEYNVSVNGGNDKSQYYLSLGYLSDPSYVTRSSFERFSSRLNLDSQVNNWLKVGGNMSFVHRITNSRSSDGSTFNSANIFTYARVVPSIYPIYARNNDGSYMYDANGNRALDYLNGYSTNGNSSGDRIALGPNPMIGGLNPLSFLDLDKSTQKFDNFAGAAYAEVKFLQDFTARATFNADMVFGNNKYFTNNQAGTGADPQWNGILETTRTNRMVLNSNQTIEWARNFGNHNINVLAGHEFYYQKYEYLNAANTNMLIPGMDEFNNFIGFAEKGYNPSGYTNATALESYFGRVNYNYKDKYYLSGSIRTDGSSKFRYNKWGTFWSAGGAWRMAEENFIRNNASWINELKVRASVGTTGNQDLNDTDYPFADLWEIQDNGGEFGVKQVWWGNRNITWESNLKIDAGIDFRLWERFYGSIDFYRNVTRQLLYKVPQAASTGVASVMTNDGKLANQGIEIDLNYDILRNNRVFWTVNINGAHNKQKLLRLPEFMMEAASGDGYATGAYIYKIGGDMYTYYWGEGAGVDPKTGLQYYWMDEVDAEGNLTGKRVKTTNKDEQTMYTQGSALPDFQGGINTTVRYAGFDLTVNTTFSIGGLANNSEYGNLIWNNAILGRNLHKDLIDNTWTPTNTDAEFPIFAYGYSIGDRAEIDLIDASYFCLKNVTLGYTVPERTVKRIGLSSVRVFASGENLFLLSRMKGLDPRQSINGATAYPAYSQMRTVSFGLNVNF